MAPEVQLITDILGWIRSGGDIAVIVLILYAGFKRWWVWGWQYEQAMKDASDWKAAALTGTYSLDRLTKHITPSDKG